MECGGDSDSGSSSGSGCAGCGCGGGGGGSTPFLQLVGKNGEIITLNDIMVTNPSSMFSQPEDGARALKRGDIGFDVYPLDITQFRKSDEINLLLKEIEFETSSISTFSYATAEIKNGSELATSDSHEVTHIISKNRAITKTDFGSKNHVNKDIFSDDRLHKDLSDRQPIKASLVLEAGEEISFSVTKNQNGATNLAVAAFFHNLHSGGAEKFISDLQEIPKESVKSFYQTNSLIKKLPVFGSLSLLLAVFLPFSATLDDQSLIKMSNSIPTAHADTPHGGYSGSKSLYYYYKNTVGQWVHFSTMHPRFKLAQRVVAEVPEIAFANGNNEVSIKVVSNTTHYIYSIGLVDQVETVKLSDFTPITGTSNGATKHSFADGATLVTLPGDEFKFTVSNMDKKATHVFFKIQGHYSPLLCKDESAANQWWNKLSSQEQAMMKTPSAYGV
jgi:hypothetical protein